MKEYGFLVYAGLIGLAIAVDAVTNQAQVSLFLVHKLLALVEYLSFWR